RSPTSGFGHARLRASLPTGLVRDQIGLSRGFGNPLSPESRHHQIHRAFQIHPMPRRDENRPSPRPGTQHGTHHLSFVDQRTPIAPVRTGLLEPAYQPGLSATYGGTIDQEPQMGGDAQPPRVSDPLPVNEHDLRAD